ncbi:MAG: ElyC/SanA/YdcF family protein [Lachnospirales bacterium]
MKKKVIIISLIFLTVFLIFYIYLLGTTIKNSSNYDYKKSDAILVLGYSIKNGEPSKFLERRLETALDLYIEGYSDTIIVTGGQGPKDDVPVAIVMRDWLVKEGIPSENIFVEGQAKNTYENFAYSSQLASSQGLNSIIFVTNDFHMNRSMITGKEFFNIIWGRESDLNFNFRVICDWLKEPFSIVKYYLFDKNTIPAPLFTEKTKQIAYANVTMEPVNLEMKKYEIEEKSAKYNITVDYQGNNTFTIKENIEFTNNTDKTINSINISNYYKDIIEEYQLPHAYLSIHTISSKDKALEYSMKKDYINVKIPALRSGNATTMYVQYDVLIPYENTYVGANSKNIWATDIILKIVPTDVYKPFYNSYTNKGFYNFDTMDITFNVPRNYTVITSGNEHETIGKDKNTIEVRDFIGNNFAFSLNQFYKAISTQINNSMVNIYVEGDNLTNVSNYLHDVTEILEYLNSEIGKYCYDELDILFLDMGETEYLSNTGIIYLNSNLLTNENSMEIIATAITEQYFNHIIAFEPRSTFISNGLSQLYTNIFLGRPIDTDYNINLNIDSTVYSNDDQYYKDNFLKPSKLINLLYNKDKTAFVNFIRNYFSHSAFKVSTKKDFLDSIKEFLPEVSAEYLQ